jgi:hypothetical protein
MVCSKKNRDILKTMIFSWMAVGWAIPSIGYFRWQSTTCRYASCDMGFAIVQYDGHIYSIVDYENLNCEGFVPGSEVKCWISDNHIYLDYVYKPNYYLLGFGWSLWIVCLLISIHFYVLFLIERRRISILNANSKNAAVALYPMDGFAGTEP